MDSGVFFCAQWLCAHLFAEMEPENVCCPNASPSPGPQNVHMTVRRRFVYSPGQDPLRIRITADDYYKLYINDHFVGQGPAQGYWFCYYWNEFDVTGLLREGENEIRAEVYYQGLVNRAYNSGDRRMGLIAALLSGDRCILATDGQWEYALSEAFTVRGRIGCDTQFAEDFDGRVSPGNWRFCCVRETDHCFSEVPAKPLQVYRRPPVLAQPLPGGGTLYDFGEEITGAVCVTASGQNGERIRILYGEELEDSEVRVRYRMRCNCDYEEFWTLPEGRSSYEPYEYKGFRYAAVIPEGTAHVEAVEAVVRHYPFDDGFCMLETRDPVLAAVWNICKNGVKYGSQEVFVDCPTREKGQYAGDLTVTSASHIVLTGDLSLLKKAIDNQMQSARLCEGLLAVTPGSFWQEIADYSLQFPILALRYYGYTGDREYLMENLRTCDGILRFFRRYAREDGLLENVSGTWNLVDWPANLRDGYDFPLEEPQGAGAHTVLNAFYIGCIRQTEEMAALLGEKREPYSEKLTAAFRKAFFDKDTGLYRDSERSAHSSLHANVIPAYYGLYRPDEEAVLGDFLVGKGLCCGVYMAYFLLKSLCRMGRYAEAYELIVSQGEHSWYNMVREGATTCFEAWGKAQKWNTSLCHPWASAPISILAEEVLPHIPSKGKVVYRTQGPARKNG